MNAFAMIQRIQTLHLLFVLIFTLIALFFPPFLLYPDGGAVEYHFADLHHMNLLVWAIFGLSLVAIFLFKNRKMQMKLLRMASLFTLGWIVWFAAELLMINSSLEPGTSLDPELSALLPVLTLFALLLAVRGVRRDEELVRSADRLR